MGVAWVFETKENARSVELAFEQAGASLLTPAKTFKVDCTWFRPQTGSIGSFYLLHHSNFPESSFIIGAPAAEISTNSTTQSNSTRSAAQLPPIPPRATSNQGFDLILEKFSTGLKAENNTRFELVGNEYCLKDFRLRVGTVSSATTVKGVIVEIEYPPSTIVYQCNGIVQECVEIFFPGQTQRKKPDIFLRHTQPDQYMSIDTLGQYLDIFLAMKKKA